LIVGCLAGFVFWIAKGAEVGALRLYILPGILIAAVAAVATNRRR
jgi:hypothetical protein